MPLPIKCYSYRRVSSRSQLGDKSDKVSDEEDMNDSLSTQGRNAAKWVEERKDKGFVLDTTFRLEDRAVSASMGINLAKGKLRDFLEYCKDGTVRRGSYLLFDKWDRGSRGNVMEQFKLLSDLFEYDITIVTVYNGQEYSTKIFDVESHKIWVLVGEMIAANAFSNNLRHTAKQAWVRRRVDSIEKGKVLDGVCPSWLTRKDGKYFLIPENAVIIRRIFSEYINGYGCMLISQGLNTDGIPTFTSKGFWSSGRVSALLRNKAIIGYHTFKAERLEFDRKPRPIKADGTEGFEEHKIYITDEELISDATWTKAQNIRLLKGTKRGAKFNYSILEKLLYCGYYNNMSSGLDDRGKIRLITRGKDARYSIFQSDKFIQSLEGGINQYWRQDCLEAAFINSMILTSLKVESETEDLAISDLRNGISTLDLEIDNKQKLAKQRNDDLDTLDMSKESRQDSQRRITKFQLEINELSSKRNTLNKELEETLTEVGSEDDIKTMQNSYLSNLGNAKIISSINIKLRESVRAIYLYSLGISYNEKEFHTLIRRVNRIGIEYANKGYKFKTISLKQFEDMTPTKFEYCPYLYFHRIFKHVPKVDKTLDNNQKRVDMDVMNKFRRAILYYPRVPTTNKLNRFFVVSLINKRVFIFKTKDSNLERNRLSPLCEGIEWGYNGSHVIGTKEAHKKLYSSKMSYSAKFGIREVKEGHNFYNSMVFENQYIELQKRPHSPNLGKPIKSS